MVKKRLDVLLVEKGLFPSREKAAEAIKKGRVRVHGKAIVKPSTLIEVNTPIFIKREIEEFVSRGAHKLKHALETFEISVSGKKCVDIGSSTGGFVDCLLRYGASKVVAVDTGKGQLDDRLRRDERVMVLENYNARYLRCEDLPFTPELVTIDVSFISVKKIFPAVYRCKGKDTEFIILIKPQFEAGPDRVRKGIVRDIDTHREIVEDFISYFSSYGFNVAVEPSPIRGAKGNIEYLYYLTHKPGVKAEKSDKIVEKAFCRKSRDENFNRL